jgi:eukaryotic-like serine/threonine-protein kinase
VHKEGIVHRDVKPGNIVVTTDGGVFLIDFGIARSASDPSLTGMAILGTLEYLAPERFAPNAEVGPPADIWALGVTLFYALEGYSPFRHGQEDTESVMVAILQNTPTPARRGPLADIMLRMLDKDPGRRAAAAEVRRALQAVIDGQPSTSRRPAPPPPRLPAAPERASRSGPVSASALASLGKEIVRGETGKGASMLVSLDITAAARIVADCPAKERGALLQGIAAIEPGTAATILRMLLADAAGRAFGDLRPKTAAALLDAMPAPEAARILNVTGTQAAASVLMELGPSRAAARLRSLPDRRRAADVLARMADVNPQFASHVLPHLTESFRVQVSDSAGDLPGRHALTPRDRA